MRKATSGAQLINSANAREGKIEWGLFDSGSDWLVDALQRINAE
jgi:hypothetical protein